MNVLNLYAGIGGNRALWTNANITAVEYNENIAQVYRDRFPDDTVIIADAKQYLLEHYKEYEIIWASPPCQTHSRAKYWGEKSKQGYYQDMSLWQIILFMQNFVSARWVVENVIPFYEPLIMPTIVHDRHMFWSNTKLHNLPSVPNSNINAGNNNTNYWKQLHKIDLSEYRGLGPNYKIYRNCVNMDLGLAIFEQLQGIQPVKKDTQLVMF